MNRSQRILASLLFFSLTTFLTAQMTVSGTVTDGATGSALPGANVVVDGTNNGAAEMRMVLLQSTMFQMVRP